MSHIYIYIYIHIYIYMEHLFLMFLDHTQRRTTGGRTPLNELSARHRDLYLTTHDTHNRQISLPPVGFEPTISAGERPVAAHLLRSIYIYIYIYDISSLRVNTLCLKHTLQWVYIYRTKIQPTTPVKIFCNYQLEMGYAMLEYLAVHVYYQTGGLGFDSETKCLL